MEQKKSEYRNYLGLRCEQDVEDGTMIEERTWSRDPEARLYKTQMRQMGGKFIMLSEEENGNLEKTTNLSEKEEEEFEDKWKKLWNLKIFHDIETAINTETEEEKLKDRLKQLLSQNQIWAISEAIYESILDCIQLLSCKWLSFNFVKFQKDYPMQVQINNLLVWFNEFFRRQL